MSADTPHRRAFDAYGDSLERSLGRIEGQLSAIDGALTDIRASVSRVDERLSGHIVAGTKGGTLAGAAAAVAVALVTELMRRGLPPI